MAGSMVGHLVAAMVEKKVAWTAVQLVSQRVVMLVGVKVELLVLC